MTKRLSAHGYLRVEQVAEPGEFAVRGAVFDVFPTGSAAPVRVDLFDDEIETLRTFDPQTQLSAGRTDKIEILPAREFPFDEAAIKFVSRALPRALPRRAGPLPGVPDDLRRAAAGRHRVLPAAVLQDDGVAVRLPARRTRCSSSSRARSRRSTRRGSSSTSATSSCKGDIERPILPPDAGVPSPGRAARAHRGAADAHADTARLAPSTTTQASRIRSRAGVAATDDRIDRWLGTEQGERTLLATSSPGHREMLLELLRGRGYEPRVYANWQEFLAGDAPLGITVAEIHDGFRFAARQAARHHRHGSRHGAAAPAPTQAPRTRSRNHHPRAHRPAGRRARRPRGLRRRPLPRPHDARRRGHADGVPAARVRRRRQALRARAEPAPRDALQRRVARGRAAAPARHGSVGRRPNARPRSRPATRPPSC